jgi:hypothetical protein
MIKLNIAALQPCLHEGRVTLALGLTLLVLVSQGERKQDLVLPAELIVFPERYYGSTVLVSIFRAGKMGNAN